ncbi:hypothetical protein INR49_023637 [Caranx melampygus]|nr:hypothetical protein INR49_023637 [Caranx melampygus]
MDTVEEAERVVSALLFSCSWLQMVGWVGQRRRNLCVMLWIPWTSARLVVLGAQERDGMYCALYHWPSGKRVGGGSKKLVMEVVVGGLMLRHRQNRSCCRLSH